MTINRMSIDPSKLDFVKTAKMFSDLKGGHELGGMELGAIFSRPSAEEVRGVLMEAQESVLSRLLPSEYRDAVSVLVRHPVSERFLIWSMGLRKAILGKPGKLTAALEDVSRKANEFESSLIELGKDPRQVALLSELSKVDPSAIEEGVSASFTLTRHPIMAFSAGSISTFLLARIDLLRSMGEELDHLEKWKVSAPTMISKSYSDAASVGGYFGMCVFGFLFTQRTEPHTGVRSSEESGMLGPQLRANCVAVERAILETAPLIPALAGYSELAALNLFLWKAKISPGEEMRVATELGTLLLELKQRNVPCYEVAKFLESVEEPRAVALFEAVRRHPELCLPLSKIKSNQLSYPAYDNFVGNYLGDTERYSALWSGVKRWIEVPKMAAPAAHLLTHSESLSQDPNLERAMQVAERCRAPADFFRNYATAVLEGRSDRGELLCRLYDAKLSDTKLHSLQALVTQSLDRESGDALVASLGPSSGALVAGLENFASEKERRSSQKRPSAAISVRAVTWQEEIKEGVRKNGASSGNLADVEFLLENLPQNIRTLPKRFWSDSPETLVPLAEAFRKLHNTQTFILLLNNEEYCARYREKLAHDKHGSFSEAVENLCLSAHVASHDGLRNLLGIW